MYTILTNDIRALTRIAAGSRARPGALILPLARARRFRACCLEVAVLADEESRWQGKTVAGRRTKSGAQKNNGSRTQGALARWAGRCARHPWRVVSTWVGIFVVLIGLNAAFHGKLINDFKIPGSDTQKATDLIKAKFGGEKGAALRVVLSSPNRAARLARRDRRRRPDARRRQGVAAARWRRTPRTRRRSRAR